MKALFKRWLAFSLALFFMLILSLSCEEEANYREFEYPEPEVTQISPTEGYPSQNLTISGSNFGDVSGSIKVYFNGVQAETIVSVTDSEIVVEVPEDALSGKVSLDVWTHSLDSLGVFSVKKKPTIVSVESKGALATNIASPGDEVWISGTNFPEDISRIQVDFNGTLASQIISASGDLIKVIAPAGYEAGDVSVIFDDELTVQSSGYALSPGISPGDVSVLFLKNYKQPFTHDNMPDGSNFNGTNWATPDFWTINDAAKNQSNGGSIKVGGSNYGKPGMRDVGELALQAGYGSPNFTNGKMYQTATLPSGDYKLEIEIMEAGFNSYLNGTAVYLTSAAGSELPDLVSPGTAPQPVLATEVIQNGIGYGNKTVKAIEFSLSEPTEVSMGFVATMVSNSYVRMNYMKLFLLDENGSGSEVPEGNIVFDFNESNPSNYWVGLQNATNSIVDGKLRVLFDNAQFGAGNKRRADLKYVEGGTFPSSEPTGKWQYDSDFPILAFKINFLNTGKPVPEAGNIKLDRFMGAENNVYLTDFTDDNVIYYDLAVDGGFTNSQELASFQLKMADITSDETGYEIDWIRSFASIEDLQKFLNN